MTCQLKKESLNATLTFLFLGFLDKNNDLLYRSGKEVILLKYKDI